MSTEKLPQLTPEHRADRIRAERLQRAYSQLRRLLDRQQLTAEDQQELQKIEYELFGDAPRFGTLRFGQK